jgi:hypothetical protein
MKDKIKVVAKTIAIYSAVIAIVGLSLYIRYQQGTIKALETTNSHLQEQLSEKLSK